MDSTKLIHYLMCARFRVIFSSACAQLKLRCSCVATWVLRCRKSMRRNPLTPDTTPQMFWFTGNNAIQMEISEVQS